MLPSRSRAMEWLPPADTWTNFTPAGAATMIGAVWFVVVPSPSWPLVLLPQAYRLPSEPTASEWDCPADTWANRTREVGVSRCTSVPPREGPWAGSAFHRPQRAVRTVSPLTGLEKS